MRAGRLLTLRPCRGDRRRGTRTAMRRRGTRRCRYIVDYARRGPLRGPGPRPAGIRGRPDTPGGRGSVRGTAGRPVASPRPRPSTGTGSCAAGWTRSATTIFAAEHDRRINELFEADWAFCQEDPGPGPRSDRAHRAHPQRPPTRPRRPDRDGPALQDPGRRRRRRRGRSRRSHTPGTPTKAERPLTAPPANAMVIPTGGFCETDDGTPITPAAAVVRSPWSARSAASSSAPTTRSSPTAGPAALFTPTQAGALEPSSGAAPTPTAATAPAPASRSTTSSNTKTAAPPTSPTPNHATAPTTAGRPTPAVNHPPPAPGPTPTNAEAHPKWC